MPRPRLLIIDNYDSFTFNLAQIVKECGIEDLVVATPDELDPDRAGEFPMILISPGPGLPEDFPKNQEIIKRFGPTHRILGVCLGHQAIAVAYGAGLENLPHVNHGITKRLCIEDQESGLFRDIPDNTMVGLYHSWAVQPSTIPGCLKIMARADDGMILALRHKDFDVFGVQFHPESVMTPYGEQIIRNWIHH